MAATEQEKGGINRRKLVLQASIGAKRRSLLNLIDRHNAKRVRPQTDQSMRPLPGRDTIQSMPVQSAGNVIADSRTLPGRDIVDANNSAAINLARQNPGVNLTDELNRRAAAQTNADLMKMSYGGMPESKGAVIQDQFYTNAEDAQVAAPEIPTPLPAIQPTPFNYGPGLTPARAEELYGPGGMYGTAPLPGGAYEQMGISPTMMGTQGATQSATPTAPAFPSDQTLKSTSSLLTDAVKKIKKRAAIIRGTAALLGGDSRAADRYEAKALASLGVYAGQYAMSQLTDKDFKDKQTLMQSLIEKNMPLDQILKVLDSGVTDVPASSKLKDQAKQVFVDSEGNEHAGKLAWDADGSLKYLKRNGEPAPADWIPRAGQGTTLQANLNLSGEKPDLAIKKSMIKRSALMMAEAKKYWIDEDGKLRDELDIWDALGWQGPARTTKSKMKRALSIALRLESGAAIGEDERAQFYDLFMPNAKDWLTGDREASILDKFDDFQKYIEMIVEAIDPAWDNDPRFDPIKVDILKEVLEKAKDERERNVALDMD